MENNVTNQLLGQLLMQPPQGNEQNAGPRRSFANAIARGAEGYRQGYGERETGMPAEFLARYPGLSVWQPLAAAPADFFLRLWPGLLRGAAGFIGGLDQDMGSSETDSRRLQRELNAVAEIAGVRRLGRW